MTSARLVERHDAGTYRLGIRLLELGNLAKSRLNIRDVASPYMQALHEQVGEAINLGIRHEDEIVYIERTSSGRSLVRVVYLVGGRAPLHLTSVGKLFLAQDGPEAVRAYARRTGLPGKTPTSMTSLPALERNSTRSAAMPWPSTTRGRGRPEMRRRPDLRRRRPAGGRPVGIGAGGPAQTGMGQSGQDHRRPDLARRSATSVGPEYRAAS